LVRRLCRVETREQQEAGRNQKQGVSAMKDYLARDFSKASNVANEPSSKF